MRGARDKGLALGPDDSERLRDIDRGVGRGEEWASEVERSRSDIHCGMSERDREGCVRSIR